jgi:mono/diheme cytochrome c family protein
MNPIRFLTHVSSKTSRRPRLNALAWLGILVVATLVLSGCAEAGTMLTQPRYNTLAGSDFFADGSSARVPPDGTVPYSPDTSPNARALTGLDESGQPVTTIAAVVDQNMVADGKAQFNIYCIPCHGPTGEGNGKVTGFGFAKPPSLLADEAKALKDGEIFSIITDGKGKMFPYGYRVKPDERWAIIAYVRALQLKNGEVKPQELTEDELNSIRSKP